MEYYYSMSTSSSYTIAQDTLVKDNPLPGAATDKPVDFPYDLLLKISYRMYKENNKNEYIGNFTSKKRQQAN